jgi:hypothetical protein
MTMSLKCSIFGCRWGDTEVEREREEDGSEVIITIRETETCSRCGDVRVVSENKEVTTLETAADIVADDLADDSPEQSTGATPSGAADEPAPAGEEPAPEEATGGEPATTIPDAESDAVVTADDAAPTGGDPPEDVDDAVILDDGKDDPGETASRPEPEQPAETGQVEQGGGDEGWDASEPAVEQDQGAEIVGEPETDADEESGERDHGEWPEEPDDGDDWEQPTDIGHRVDEEPSGFGTVGNAVTVPEGEFYCPECAYTTPVESSSLRAGDYCPECHRGSLEHRSD